MKTLLPLLAALSLTAALPKPRIKHLPVEGELEISVEDVPGVRWTAVQYHLAGKSSVGTLYPSVDGVWRHRADVAGSRSGKLKYTLIGQTNGEPVVTSGTVDTDSDDRGAVVVSPQERPRRGRTLVFRDDFNSLDTGAWEYEVSMYGGYNWEIQTLTADKFNESFLTTGVMDSTILNEAYNHSAHVFSLTSCFWSKAIWGKCTNEDRYGCHREGRYGLLPPVMSAKLKSRKTVRFGYVCARARIPQGDWIWPAIWMLPQSSHYGQWPRSGEIDLMESRGNSVARAPDGNDHGRNEVGSTMHWGPDAGQNKFYLTHGERDDGSFSTQMHDYCVDWTQDHISITVDGHEVMRTGGNFWQKGGFGGSNPWAGGSHMAPFDQPFYLILNVAVGGTSGFFPDDWTYNSRKPWRDGSTKELEEFWAARHEWQPSWQGDMVAMEVDWVEILLAPHSILK
ncbi:BGBP-like protein [Mya arenaria]|uniref:BGBP-like protein n=1 Tax=Mya arenaria TaxID=6604 RepID=A0ABY7EEF2_MYAAR|nr:BGBP-like protein [Mya arenaria]